MSFAADFSDCSPDFDDHFGEPWTLLPQIEDDSAEYFAEGADPTQQQRALVGIYSEDPVISTVLGSGANTHENADVSTAKITIGFALELFADPQAQPVPAAGWVLRREQALGKPLYEVVVAQSDGVSRLVCKVVYKGMSPA